jgi:hypothetical protein
MNNLQKEKPVNSSESTYDTLHCIYIYTQKICISLSNNTFDFAGSHASNNPTLNFLTYIPSRNQHPLLIHQKRGKYVFIFSF